MPEAEPPAGEALPRHRPRAALPEPLGGSPGAAPEAAAEEALEADDKALGRGDAAEADASEALGRGAGDESDEALGRGARHETLALH